MLAAYAFVLNALLATTLLAATPPSKSFSGFELCASVADTSIPAAHDDNATKRAAVHCQLCLQQAEPAALPPSPEVSVYRVATPTAAPRLTHQQPPALADRLDHRPRGPPHLT